MFTQLIGTGLIFSGIVDTSSAGADVETGSILPYGGSTAPTGYVLCDGAVLNRTTFAALFAIIGTSYGAGNGSTTFNVPNLKDRFPAGAGNSSGARGASGGSWSHTHSIPNLGGSTGGPGSTTLVDNITSQDLDVADAGHNHSISTDADFTDGQNPPYQVVNFIIKT